MSRPWSFWIHIHDPHDIVWPPNGTTHSTAQRIHNLDSADWREGEWAEGGRLVIRCLEGETDPSGAPLERVLRSVVLGRYPTREALGNAYVDSQWRGEDLSHLPVHKLYGVLLHGRNLDPAAVCRNIGRLKGRRLYEVLKRCSAVTTDVLIRQVARLDGAFLFWALRDFARLPVAALVKHVKRLFHSWLYEALRDCVRLPLAVIKSQLERLHGFWLFCTLRDCRRLPPALARKSLGRVGVSWPGIRFTL